MTPQDIPQIDDEASDIATKIAEVLVHRETASLGTTRDDLICANFLPAEIDKYFPQARHMAAARMVRDLHGDLPRKNQTVENSHTPPSAP